MAKKGEPRRASSLSPLVCLFSHSVCVKEEEESRVVPKKDGHNGAEGKKSKQMKLSSNTCCRSYVSLLHSMPAWS